MLHYVTAISGHVITAYYSGRNFKANFNDRRYLEIQNANLAVSKT